ncbi:MAG TPA: hypothetical protein VFT72_07870 [Opitutaceae bacterium]|nr:hypothetical protein [Opitutaceae bacterium]
MTPTSNEMGATAPRGFRRVAPAFVLFFMSPFVAEFLLGNISISAMAGILFMGPLYGGGAILIREFARRHGRGWPTIVLLALAYGLVEEGIVIQTLFNPNYLGFHLLAEAYVPSLGIGGWWTPFVLTLHTVWSISVPIAVTEALFAERRKTPWLGKIGLGVATLLFLAGAFMIHFGTHHQDPFVASPMQLIGVAVLVVLFVAAAFRWKKNALLRTGFAPKPVLVGVLTFALGLAFMSAHAAIHGWAIVAVYGVLFVLGIALLGAWSSRANWTPLHTLAAAGGAMMTYACTAFPQEPVIGAKGTVDLVGNCVFAAVAIALLAFAVRSQRRAMTAN